MPSSAWIRMFAKGSRSLRRATADWMGQLHKAPQNKTSLHPLREPSGCSCSEESRTPAATSQLETAMGMIIAVFDKYAKSDGNRQALTKTELKTLLEKELPNFLSSGKDKDAINEVFKNLDENSDSQVDFKEFVIFVAALTSCCHKYFEQKVAK